MDLLSAFITLLVAVDPLGLGVLFLALTRHLPAGARNGVALESCVAAFLILAGAALSGQHLLAALGIDIASFRIGGGLLLFVIAFEMVFDRRHRRKEDEAEEDAQENPAIFPLAIPLLAGPAAITASILTASRAQGWTEMALLLLLIALVMLASFVTFRVAHLAGGLLGPRMQLAFSRILGILLAALAVQYVVEGVFAHLGRAT